MNQPQQQKQINENDKVYALILAGGLGARVIQTVFIRSLIKQRKQDKNSYPILVIDNSLIGMMVSEALSNQNIMGLSIPEGGMQWPHDPGLIPQKSGLQEHAMFVDSWRMQNQQYTQQGAGSWHKLIKNNMERAYQIEYGFSLTKLITKHRYISEEKSFIGYLYAKTMTDGLEYDGGLPMLKRTQTNVELKNHLDGMNKPFILLHLGVDRNPNEFMNGINYRTFKVWSIERWAELVQKLKNKYNFLQVHANQYNTTIPDCLSIKVDNLNPVLQVLEHPKCKTFMSIDNYLPHLAASIKKRGIVLWGSVSPYVWGWKHNINIWNQSSCDQGDIACWRPGIFDTDQQGKIWVCPSYSCMQSISIEQVVKSLNKLELILDNEKDKGMVTL